MAGFPVLIEETGRGGVAPPGHVKEAEQLATLRHELASTREQFAVDYREPRKVTTRLETAKEELQVVQRRIDHLNEELQIATRNWASSPTDLSNLLVGGQYPI